ncbi:LOB domain-containing protein 27-like [Magnolia sinica]|uniref:LOB domain-containing protein 27-like n=1 Tax=Magnolia sinica TaxID=86752 RepID=UPI0026596E30|nr:LOB domain-containing protein 27-like [Magnolia sinica]
MTVKGGTSQACAACKYQRRKCSADCPLAPYFPPDQPKQFQNAHRLFGVSNILKILKQLDASQKLEAMKSIVYQANIRDKYPVHGCLGIVCQLQIQIHHLQQELDNVNAQLTLYRQHHPQIMSSPAPSSQLQLGTGATATPHNALTLFRHNQPINTISTGMSFNGNLNQLWPQHIHGFNNDTAAIQPQFVQPLACQQQKVESTHEYDEIISPFLETGDDRQSYIDSKEAYECSSSEESLKDTTQSMEHVVENELKSAAACLSLTSIN